MDVCMISFVEISNQYCHMRVMEMIWGIPLFLNRLLNKYTGMRHVPPSVGLLSQTSTFWPQP